MSSYRSAPFAVQIRRPSAAPNREHVDLRACGPFDHPLAAQLRV